MKTLFKIVVILVTIQISAQDSQLNLGDKLPEFAIPDEKGELWSSNKRSSSKFLVVYFYPAAMTGGCTKQACAYRDDKESFDAMNISIVGISGDEVKNLKYFKGAYHLNFPLLSDASGEVAMLFGVPTKRGNKSLKRDIDGLEVFLKRSVTAARWTFVFDASGRLIYKNETVKAASDSNEVKKIITNYKK